MSKFDFISYSILISVVAIVVLAFIKGNKWIKVSAVIILDTLILWREFGIGVYARRIVWEGKVSDEFKNGASAIVDFCNETSIFVFVALLIITIICIRDLKQ